jgi:ketosteroid isomerase-like protein
MFERYTEKAVRVVFFARYEASRYGSSYIESEHLLLGLLREDRMLATRFMRPNVRMGEIRDAIERQIQRRERVSTSVEMPVSEDCRKIFSMAGEEARSLGQRHVGTEHLLLAMTRMESSLAGRLLHERGLRPDAIRTELAKSSVAGSAAQSAQPPPQTGAIDALNSAVVSHTARDVAVDILNSFFAGLHGYDWERLAPFFAESAQFVDAAGKCWKGRGEIEKQFEVLFAPYAKKNVTFVIEATDPGPAEFLIASVLWENVSAAGESKRSIHRMTIVLAPEKEEWSIFLIQFTPVVA